MADKIHIALISGGYTGEHAVSLKSALTIDANLDRSKYVVTQVIVVKEGWTAHREGQAVEVDRGDFSILTVEGKEKVDFAYIIVHGTPGEDGLLQGYLDMLGIPYSSGSALNTCITFDKAMTQTVLKANGIKVAQHIILRRGEQIDEEAIVSALGLPCFVKPTQAGSSLGISRVKEVGGVRPAIAAALELGDTVIIEQALIGKEITCAVYRTDEGIIPLPVTEIVYHSEFFDYKAKYEDSATEEITPARITELEYLECQQMARLVYQLLDCRGIVRVDFFLCQDGLYIIEMNTVPGMSAESIVPRMLRAVDADLSRLLDDIIDFQMTEYMRKKLRS